MRFFPNTLTSRLFLLSSATALIGLAVVAFVITADYRASSERRLNEVLLANAYNLMSSLELGPEETLTGAPILGDARYALFDSGWYWSVENMEKPDTRIASQSLADQRIPVPEEVPLDDTFQRYFEITDQAGQALLGLEVQLYLGESDDIYSVKVTANKNVIEADAARFSRRLAIILAVFAFSIVMATYLMVRVGLKPLEAAKESLAAIRSGEAERIEGQFPDEIQPLVDETNALIDSNNTIIERARTQVGNLAHSLKTPLAVLQNEVAKLSGGKKSLFSEQLDLMKQQVQVYLDRARISARSSTAIARTPAFEVLDKIVMVVGKLNQETRIEIKADQDGLLIFEGEEHDLQEIFGNLIENAAKYATGQVMVRLAHADNAIRIDVEDDGPGMSRDEMERAMKRGGRVDEGKTGWGLGMSIVRDIVDEYSGMFELSKSGLGGLKASVLLPGRIERS